MRKRMSSARRASGGEPEVMVDINTTPLIDVMLVLLIMLIITIPIQMHSVKMNLPVGDPPPSAPPPVVQLNIDVDGAVTWNGATVENTPDLEARMKGAAAQPQQPEIHLLPNAHVAYKNVAAVLAAAQREGVTNIGLVGNEQYMQ